MKYPTKVNIRGYKYRIEYVENPREVDRDFESIAYLGTCSSKVIRILAKQTQLSLIDSIVHEIIHAVFTRNPMLKQALKDGMEESFVATIGGEIAEILLNNKWVNFSKQPPITVRINSKDLQD
jgi:hypothetical protein